MVKPVIVELEPSMVLDDFDCGDRQVNEFLKEKAKDQQERFVTKVYVMRKDNEIIGYYAVFCSHFRVDLPEDRKFEFNVPGVCMGQLGIDNRYKRKGLGTEMIKHCVSLAHKINKMAACRIIWLMAYDSVIDYYSKRPRNFLLTKQLRDKNRMIYDLKLSS